MISHGMHYDVIIGRVRSHAYYSLPNGRNWIELSEVCRYVSLTNARYVAQKILKLLYILYKSCCTCDLLKFCEDIYEILFIMFELIIFSQFAYKNQFECSHFIYFYLDIIITIINFSLHILRLIWYLLRWYNPFNRYAILCLFSILILCISDFRFVKL